MNATVPSLTDDAVVLPLAEPDSATDDAPADATGSSMGDVIDMLLKDQPRLDRALREEAGQRSMIPKLLGIAMAGFTIYGVVATVMLNLAHQSHFWLPYAPPAYWNDRSAANLTLAYTLGLIAANGICLPSFYFYALLSGVRISMVGIVAHACKGMAVGALMLVGILPIYVALVLCAVVYTSNPGLLTYLMIAVLALPFLAGTWGAVCLYRGFMGLCDTMHPRWRLSRTCMLQRFIVAWCGCYIFVTPLVIYSLWMNLAKALEVGVAP